MRSTCVLFSISALAIGAMGCSVTSTNNTPGSADASMASDSATPSPDSGTPPTPDAMSAADGTAPDAGVTGDSGLPGSDAGADGGSDLPPPNLSNVCPDSNPTNTTFATAQALTVNSAGQARIGAGVVTGSDEWFRFTAPKQDPAHVLVNYTVGTGNTSQLGLRVYDVNDIGVTSDTSARMGNSQTLSTFFETTAGGTFAVDIASDNATCTPFDLFVKSLYCTDQYEDNDDSMHGAPIALTATPYAAPTTWATATANIIATIDGLDDDWYAVTAPLSDPMSSSVTYTRPTGDTVDLQLRVNDTNDNGVTSDTAARSGPTQTLNTVWEAVAGDTYRIGVTSNVTGVCADYSAAFNGLWCTDNFEDNDTFATAKAIPATATTATITSGDDDWYTITGPSANGSCAVTYSVPTGTAQHLNVYVVDINDNGVSSDTTARTQPMQTLTASWASTDAPYAVHVTADNQVCTQYTITCH